MPKPNKKSDSSPKKGYGPKGEMTPKRFKGAAGKPPLGFKKKAKAAPVSHSEASNPNPKPRPQGSPARDKFRAKSKDRQPRPEKSFGPPTDLYREPDVLPTFAELGLAEPIARAITEMGFECPTPIQARAIPVLLSGRDLIGQAQTGTGKTAAFALPMIERVDPTRMETQALILAPTR
jgi:ATP-dependent helicase YprA (DUF1998 family)